MSSEGRTGRILQKILKNRGELTKKQVAGILAMSLLFASIVPYAFNGETLMGLKAYGAADTLKPLVTIEKPASGAKLSAGTIMVSGEASDNKGGSGIKSVEVRLDGGPYKTAKPKTAGDWSTWSISFSVSKGGSHEFKAKAMDRSGNIDWDTVPVSVTVASMVGSPDTTDPKIAITYPVDGSTVAATSSITVRGTASDSGGSGMSTVQLRVDSGPYKTATPKAPGDWSTWSVTVPISIGEHRLVPRATDKAGNQNWNSIHVIIDDSPVPPPPPPPKGSSLDPFGIVKLYPTAAGGSEYYTKTTAVTVSDFTDRGNISRLPSGFSKNADGSWHIPSNSDPRWVISGGWRNVEVTMQLKINSGSQVQIYANGEEHTTKNSGAWHGSANKMRVYSDGRIGFVKELYHESGNSGYASTTAVKTSGTPITGKWVTVKYVGYNIDNNTHRKLEGYISMNNDNKFIKVSELVDNGRWYASSGFDSFMAHMRQNYPGAVPENRDTGQEMKRNEVITWKGEWVSFRSDGADYDFKNVSVREIAVAN